MYRLCGRMCHSADGKVLGCVSGPAFYHMNGTANILVKHPGYCLQQLALGCHPLKVSNLDVQGLQEVCVLVTYGKTVQLIGRNEFLHAVFLIAFFCRCSLV